MPVPGRDLEEALEMGVDWSLREGYAWAEDKEHCEEYGRMLQADPNKVSSKAKKRGLPQVANGETKEGKGHQSKIHQSNVLRKLVATENDILPGVELTPVRAPPPPQLGTLGAGNHYAEIQVVDEIYDDYAAKKMGVDHKGQVCVMIHSGSRGLGHQVATGSPRAAPRRAAPRLTAGKHKIRSELNVFRHPPALFPRKPKGFFFFQTK